MEKVVIDTSVKYISLSLAVSIILKYGYKFIEYKKTTSWFGLKTKSHSIVLEKVIDYPLEVKMAINEERYENVRELKSKYQSEEQFYKQLNQQKYKDLMLLQTFF